MAKASPTKTANNKIRKPVTKQGEAKASVYSGPSDGNLEERIRQRAYELYEQEGRQEGRDEEYWLRAEAEIRGRKTA